MEFKTSLLKRSERTKTNRRKDGSTREVKIAGGLFYRISYVDLDGRPRTVERGPFATKRQRQDRLDAELLELKKSQGRSRDSDRMTFSELADICVEELFHQPEYVKDQDGNRERISGLKSWKTVRSQVEHLKDFFGNHLIKAMTTDALRKYGTHRRKQLVKTKTGAPRRHVSVATVNREFATLRRIMRYALGRGWVLNDIFAGAGVIRISAERKRSRILSKAEEKKLLEACTGVWKTEYKRIRDGHEETLERTVKVDNKHLRAILILAIDSGMRRNEILSLRWADIDLKMGTITVIGTHTKTEETRIVPLSERGRVALEEMRPISPGRRPFPFSTIKRSFETAKRLAGIEGLRFHDLRSTAATRLSKQYPPGIVAKILGHASVSTTMKYYVANELETILGVKEWLDSTEKD